MIKGVLSTYPLYAMQTNVLPSNVLDDITKNLEKNYGTSLVEFSILLVQIGIMYCLPMQIGGGGLGFKNLKIWNLWFMEKLRWKILTQPKKFLVQNLLQK